MRFSKAILALACLISGMACVSGARIGQIGPVAQQAPRAPEAPAAEVTQLLSKNLTDLPGKEAVMLAVEYPPGGADPIHRHYAHAFVYVVEGSIVMQLRGGPETVVTAGQTFYEGPDDIHIVGRSASQTEPAKFIVFLVKDIGVPVVVPAD